MPTDGLETNCTDSAEPTDSSDSPESSDCEVAPRPEWLTSIRWFWGAAAGLAVLLFCLIPVINTGYIALPDEGVYSAQAAALSIGSWQTARPAPDFDTTGIMDPLGSSATVGKNRIPYHRHPLFSILLTPAYKLGGTTGLLSASVLAGLLTAILTGLLARRIAPEYGLPAMLLCAVGGPLLFSSYLVVGQSFVALAAAAVVLSASHLIMGGRKLAYLPLAVFAMTVPMLRSEGAVFIAGSATALLLISLPFIRLENPHRVRSFTAGLVLGTAGVAGFIIDLHWARSIASYGNSFYTNPSKAIGGEQTSILRGAWIALLQPWKELTSATPWLPGVMLCVVIGAVALRISPKSKLLPPTMFALAGILSIGFAVTNESLITGLFATTPLLFFALLWLKRPQFNDPLSLFLVLVASICSVGLVVTIYGDGGSAQWGGRLFQVVLPSLIPLAVIAMFNAGAALDRNARRLTAIGLAIMTLSIGVSGLRQNHAMRITSKMFADAITSTISELRATNPEVNDRTLFFFSQYPATGVTRALWQSDVRLNLLTVDFKALFGVLTMREFSGRPTVVVLSDFYDAGFEVLNKSLGDGYNISVEKVTLGESYPPNIYLYSNLDSTHKG